MLGNNLIKTDVENTNKDNNAFHLEQNYPNPFNPSTKIKYKIDGHSGQSVHVEIKIYDLTGREVTTLVNQEKTGGEHEIEFDAAKYGLCSGVYFYQIIAGNFKSTKKMMILK